MRKKVLFVIESLSGGGAEKVLSVLLKYIDKTKFDVTLCTIVDTGVYVDEVKQYVRYSSVLGNPNHLSFIGKLWYAFLYKLVYQFLPLSWVYRFFLPKGNDIEVAFVEGFVTKLLACSTNKKSKKIAWVHIDLLYNPWTIAGGIFKNEIEEQQAYKFYTNIVCVSQTVKMNFEKKFPKCTNVLKIYNPLDVPSILQKIQNLEIKYKNDKLIKFISIGRLVEQKGYDILLEIMNRLHQENFKFELVILGEGPMHSVLNEYILQHKLSECVKLLGFTSNPYKYLSDSDCFICSSRSEGFSLAIAEAAIVGLPIISTYCSGPNELLDEGRLGLLVKNTPESLYAGIKQILQNPMLFNEYALKSKEIARRFDIEKSMKEIESIL